jgi:hypothetical protein
MDWDAVSEQPTYIRTTFDSLSALSKSHEGRTRILQLMEVVEIPPAGGGVRVLILRHPGRNILTEYFHTNVRLTFLLPSPVEETPHAAPQDAEVRQAGSPPTTTPSPGASDKQLALDPQRAQNKGPKDMDVSLSSKNVYPASD